MRHLSQKVARRFLTAEAGREVFLDQRVPKALRTWAERKVQEIERDFNEPGVEADVSVEVKGEKPGSGQHPTVTVSFVQKDGRSILWNATVKVQMDATDPNWVGISRWSYDDMGKKTRIREKELNEGWDIRKLLSVVDGLI